MKKYFFCVLFIFSMIGCANSTKNDEEEFFAKLYSYEDEDKEFLEIIEKNPSLKRLIYDCFQKNSSFTDCFNERFDGGLYNSCVNKNDKETCQIIDSMVAQDETIMPSVQQCRIEDCFEVGMFYMQVKKYQQARQYFSKACKANHANACNNLGFLYNNGQGLRQNKSMAKEYFGKACDLQEQVGCNNYKILNEEGVK